MEQAEQTDQAVTPVILTTTLIVFVLDILTPSDIAVWSLYLIPLGYTRWSHVRHLTVILAGFCTALIICAHLYNPGPTHDIAIINRVLGILMVWVSVFFLKVERI
jgi:hypothetical protein